LLELLLHISTAFELLPIFELRDATLKPNFGSNSHRENHWKVP
jgi:hypothetical protein